jgi:hypothetical protein
MRHHVIDRSVDDERKDIRRASIRSTPSSRAAGLIIVATTHTYISITMHRRLLYSQNI